MTIKFPSTHCEITRYVLTICRLTHCLYTLYTLYLVSIMHNIIISPCKNYDTMWRLETAGDMYIVYCTW